MFYLITLQDYLAEINKKARFAQKDFPENA